MNKIKLFLSLFLNKDLDERMYKLSKSSDMDWFSKLIDLAYNTRGISTYMYSKTYNDILSHWQSNNSEREQLEKKLKEKDELLLQYWLQITLLRRKLLDNNKDNNGNG